MNDSYELTRKKIEITDRLFQEKTTHAFASIIHMTKLLNHLEKEGSVSQELIEQRRKRISEIRSSIVKIMNDDELRFIFETKY